MGIYTVDSVFGINREVPLNYIERDDVDGKFVDSLARDQHLVIYGSSKQGKTSLRKKCLCDTDYIVVSCQNRWGLSELHTSILKEAGYTVQQSVEKTVTGRNKVSVTAGAGLELPLFGGAKADGVNEQEDTESDTTRNVELDLDAEDSNDIIRALDNIGFSQYIVLEDFHYLPDETQRDFSFSLKTFHENSKLSYIIVGVWREDNRLIAYNGDLTDRVLSVDVDNWSREDLVRVIEEGESLLNVKFQCDFVQSLIDKCFESVHIVQEVCRRVCRKYGIIETVDGDAIVIGEVADSDYFVSKVVSEHAGRYRSFLMRFADGFQETDLQMPRWIIYAILCCSVDQLEAGIRLRRISNMIKAKHPRGSELNNGNITQILNSSTSLQNKKSVRPLVIDYDESNTSLHVVDKGFLIWLSTQDISELMEDLSLPPKLTQEELSHI